MSQFITIQVGQCGNQIGGAFWPLALQEHGISIPSAPINVLNTQKDRTRFTDDLSDALNSFFYIPENAGSLLTKRLADLNALNVRARAVLVDMEDSVVSRFQQGPLRHLFDQACTVKNYPGSGNNWAVGYCTHGQAYHEEIEETLRRTSERCDSLHGFLIMHSLGGGTGSGLGTSIVELLSENYLKIDRFASCVYPASKQDVVTAPYNVLLATDKLIEHATCVFPADNCALTEICNSHMEKCDNKNQLKYNAMFEPFRDMNSIIVNMLLHLTSGSRFSGNLNMDMNEIAMNLVPYPKLHYLFSSVSPISITAPAVSITRGSKLKDELFSNAWSRRSQLVDVDPLEPRSVIIGSAHIARGNVSLTDIRRNVERFQGKTKFTTWSIEATKVGLCSVPPAEHSSSVLSLLNSTSMSLMLKDLILRFEKLYQRKAHVHHYLQVDGFEEANFQEARSGVLSVCERYEELQCQKSMNVSRLQLI